MFTQNTLNLFGLSGIVKPDSKPIPSVRGTFGKVVAVNAGPDISTELSDLMDRYETVEGSDFSFFRETEDDPYPQAREISMSLRNIPQPRRIFHGFVDCEGDTGYGVLLHYGYEMRSRSLGIFVVRHGTTYSVFAGLMMKTRFDPWYLDQVSLPATGKTVEEACAVVRYIVSQQGLRASPVPPKIVLVRYPDEEERARIARELELGERIRVARQRHYAQTYGVKL